jgi:hypothetical protein
MATMTVRSNLRKRGKVAAKTNTALNAICPYFTMFPLDFPLGILNRYAKKGEIVLDPFAGRGTTLYAARLRGMTAFGVDSNPVAVAISQAKLANTTAGRIVRAAKVILADHKEAKHIPTGEFWKVAFHERVLTKLCRLRDGLLDNCDSEARKALRAILLGALHGPLAKIEPSYFSNQCPRTFAPKPAYAVKFWKERGLVAPDVDVLKIVERRAIRCFAGEDSTATGHAIEGDSQESESFDIPKRVSWIITSPPYYGMRTYFPDQWFRWWFLGGPDTVDYSNVGQLSHTSQDAFCQGLRAVWSNCADVAKTGCRMIVRFGAINDRRVDHLQLVKDSFSDSGWRIETLRKAGSASVGKRQADQFVSSKDAIEEYDIWASLAV